MARWCGSVLASSQEVCQGWGRAAAALGAEQTDSWSEWGRCQRLKARPHPHARFNRPLRGIGRVGCTRRRSVRQARGPQQQSSVCQTARHSRVAQCQQRLTIRPDGPADRSNTLLSCSGETCRGREARGSSCKGGATETQTGRKSLGATAVHLALDARRTKQTMRASLTGAHRRLERRGRRAVGAVAGEQVGHSAASPSTARAGERIRCAVHIPQMSPRKRPWGRARTDERVQLVPGRRQQSARQTAGQLKANSRSPRLCICLARLSPPCGWPRTMVSADGVTAALLPAGYRVRHGLPNRAIRRSLAAQGERDGNFRPSQQPPASPAPRPAINATHCCPFAAVPTLATERGNRQPDREKQVGLRHRWLALQLAASLLRPLDSSLAWTRPRSSLSSKMASATTACWSTATSS